VLLLEVNGGNIVEITSTVPRQDDARETMMKHVLLDTR